MRRVLILLCLLGLALPAYGQARSSSVPKSFGELKKWIEREKAMPASQRLRSIGYLMRFRTGRARALILLLLASEHQQAVRSALLRQLRYHASPKILGILKKEFRPGYDRTHLKAVAYSLCGQGREGVEVLIAGLDSADQTLRAAAMYGLGMASDAKAAFKALRSAYARADSGGKTEILRSLARQRATPELTSFFLALLARLQKGGKGDKRQSTALEVAVLRALRRHPPERVLAPLRQVFRTASDATLLGAAAYALSGLGSAGVRILIEALKGDPDLPQRRAAISGLRMASTSREAFSALAAAFAAARPKDQLEILGALSNHRATAELTALRLRALESEDPGTRAEAVYQLAKAGQEPVEKAVRKAALALARDPKVLANNQAKAKVFYALGRVLDRQTVGPFLELGKDASSYIKSQLRGLGLIKGLEARLIAALAEHGLGSQNVDRRLAAVLLLAACQDRAANKPLLRAMQDASALIRSHAMRSLVRRREKKVIPHLEKLLAGDDPDLQLEAMLAMHEFKQQSSSWSRQLLRLLRQGQGFVRSTAIDLLGQQKYRPALGEVQALVGAEAWQLRTVVYGFLRRVRDLSSIPLLIKRLDQEKGRLRAEAMQALRSLTAMTYREPSQWRQWWQAVGKGFRLPPAPEEKKVTGRPSAAAMTYYSIPLTSKAVAFLIDRSGSMAQLVGTARITRLEAAKQALNYVIDHCPEDFRFNLIPFNNDGTQWREKLSVASGENKHSAKKYVKAFQPSGGTNVHEALRRAFADMSVDTIYLLSDGMPTAGPITNPDELADEVRSWNQKRRIIIHTISIGTDSNLMQRLAKDSGGTYVRRI